MTTPFQNMHDADMMLKKKPKRQGHLYMCVPCHENGERVVFPVTDKSCPRCGARNKHYEGDKKYYFITYEYYKRPMAGWERSNTVVDKHPVIWLKDLNDEFRDSGEERHILFWEEITKEHFDYIDGWID